MRPDVVAILQRAKSMLTPDTWGQGDADHAPGEGRSCASLAVSGGQVVIRADQAPHADQECGATDLRRFVEDYRPKDR